MFDPQEKNKMKKIQKSGRILGFMIGLLCGVLSVIGVVVILNFTSDKSEMEMRKETSGYDSPEDAVRAYMESMKAGDFNGTLSTFAVETYVDNYDLAERLGVVSSYYRGNLTQPIQSIDNYTRSLNIVKRENELANSIFYQYACLGNMDISQPIMFKEGNEYSSAEEFLEDLTDYEWMEKLSNLKYGNILTIEEMADVLSIDPEEYQSDMAWNFESRLKQYGGDEYVPLAVEFEYDGKDYYLCIDVISYNDRWYNCDLPGVLAYRLGSSSMKGGIVER